MCLIDLILRPAGRTLKCREIFFSPKVAVVGKVSFPGWTLLQLRDPETSDKSQQKVGILIMSANTPTPTRGSSLPVEANGASVGRVLFLSPNLGHREKNIHGTSSLGLPTFVNLVKYSYFE